MSSLPDHDAESKTTPSAAQAEGSFVSSFPITRKKFDLASLSLVKNFSCAAPDAKGIEKRWERDVSDWIKRKPDQGGAIDAIELGGTEVWLYFAEKKLIGYASIASGELEYSGGILKTWMIPYFGISSVFQGQPKEVSKNIRYGRRIFRSILEEAKRRGIHEDVSLYVDYENTKAIENFYPDFGFSVLGKEEDDDGRIWILMHREL